MEIAKNELRIDLRSNPKLAEHYRTVADGEKSKIEIEFIKKSMDTEALTGVIDSVAPSGYKETEPVSGKKIKEIEATGEEPVMVEISAGESDD